MTEVAPVKFVPVIVNAAPTTPLVGVKLEIVGVAGTVTVKLPAEVAVPFGVVTLIFPVDAPVGTVVVICVALATWNVADVPLNFTLVAPVKLVPVTVTAAPTTPLVGVKLEIEGAAAAVTEKFVAEDAVPLGVVTLIFPVLAPVGTVALICVALMT